jgi:hypothetical protein
MYVYLSFSGPVVLDKISNDPNISVHFCDYISFVEDLALYLNNFEFPLPKDKLYLF